MSKLSLILFTLFFVHFNSQNIDKTYYLFGVVDNYMGRIYELKNNDYKGFIMKIPKEKISEISRIEQISNLNFSKINSEVFADWLFLKSEKYENEINQFYSFSKMRGSEGWLGSQNYKGILNIDKILRGNENQLVSYLLGSFLIHGKIKTENDGGDEYPIYEISVANSRSQFEVLKTILKKHSYILKEEIWNKIPTTYHIKFEPDENLKKLLDVELQFQSKN